MKKNVGTVDMIIRLGVAALLFILGLVENPIVTEPLSKKIVFAVGFVPLLTGVFRFCPLYVLAGIDTLEKKGG